MAEEKKEASAFEDATEQGPGAVAADIQRISRQQLADILGSRPLISLNDERQPNPGYEQLLHNLANDLKDFIEEQREIEAQYGEGFVFQQ